MSQTASKNFDKASGDFFATHMLIKVTNFKNLDLIFENKQIASYFETYHNKLETLVAKYGGLIVKNEIDFSEIIFGLGITNTPFTHLNPLFAINFALEFLQQMEDFNTYLKSQFHKNFNSIEKRVLMYPQGEVKELDADMAKMSVRIVASTSNLNSKKYEDRLSMVLVKNEFFDFYFPLGGIPNNNRKLLGASEEAGLYVGKTLSSLTSNLFCFRSQKLCSEDLVTYEVLGRKTPSVFFNKEKKIRKLFDSVPECILQLEFKELGHFSYAIQGKSSRSIPFNMSFIDGLSENYFKTPAGCALTYLLFKEMGYGKKNSSILAYAYFAQTVKESLEKSSELFVLNDMNDVIEDAKICEDVKQFYKDDGKLLTEETKETFEVVRKLCMSSEDDSIFYISHVDINEEEAEEIVVNGNQKIIQALKKLFSPV